MEDTTFVPLSLHLEASPGNMAEYEGISQFVYSLLESQDLPNNAFTLRINFFNKTVDQFNQSVQNAGVIEALVPTQDFAGLHSSFKYVLQPGFRLTIGNHQTIAARFDRQDLNTQIKAYARQLNREIREDTHLVECFFEIIKYFNSGIEFLLNKSMKAISLYKSIYKWTSSIANLDAQVTNMLMSLGSRTDTNNEALALVNQREESNQLFVSYVRFHDEAKWNMINVHFLAVQLRPYNFKWTELQQHITNRRIWTNHCCPSDTQIENLLEDRTLADVSAKLDSNVAKIRSYRPSIDITNISKKERVTERVTQIKTDINRFRDGNQKNPSKAKLMIESLKFLNNQLELLNLEGIPYTQESVGVEPNEVANNIEELENYLSEQDSQKKQKELSIKMNSMEFGKHLPGLQLVKLHSAENYLGWIVSYNNMAKVVTNPLTKISLIKASLANKTDQKFLEATTDVKECLEYLKNKYSNRQEILHCELQKLYRMKKAGNNLKIMLENSEKFILTANLFTMHGLIGKLDRVTRSRIIDRIMTESQIHLYLCDLIKAETIWKSKFEGRDQEEDEDEQNVSIPRSPTATENPEPRVSFSNNVIGNTTENSSSTPFTTPLHSPISTPTLSQHVEVIPPSTTLTVRYSNDQIETILENRTREHFLRHHRRYYEATRRTLYNSSMFEQNSSRRRFQNYNNYKRNQYTYKTDDNSEDKVTCQLCKTLHKPALFFCNHFRKMTVEERNHTLSNMFKDACRLCLAINNKDKNHKGGSCIIGKERNIKCHCGSTTHNALLHKVSAKSQKNKVTTKNKKGFTDNKDGKKKTGQFKRETRKQRISRSEKAYNTQYDDCTCIDSDGYNCGECHLVQHNTATIKLNDSNKSNTFYLTQIKNSCYWLQAECNKVKFNSARKSSANKHICNRHTRKENSVKRNPKHVEDKRNAHTEEVCQEKPIYLACTSECQINGPSNKKEKAIILWDNASSLNFINKKLCDQLELPRIGEWHGTLSTINNTQSVTHPIYLTEIQDYKGIRHKTICLAIDFVGNKDAIPHQILQNITKKAKIDIEDVDKADGEIKLLLGVSALKMFPHYIETPGDSILAEKFPNVRIMQCSINGKVILFGEYAVHKALWEMNKIWSNFVSQDGQTFGIFSNEAAKNVRGSFRNKKNLTLEIPSYQSYKEKTESTETLKPDSPSCSRKRLSPMAALSPFRFPSNTSIQETMDVLKELNLMKTPKSTPKFTHSHEYNFSEDRETLRKKINEEIKNLRRSQEDSPNTSEGYPCNQPQEAKINIDEVTNKINQEHQYQVPRPHSCNNCFRCSSQITNMLKHCKIINYKMNEYTCTITLECDENNCEIHKKINEVMLQIRNSAHSDIYETMHSVNAIQSDGKVVIKD